MLSFFDLLRTLSGFATGSPIIKTQKGTRSISNHLDRTSLAGKGFIKWAKRELYPGEPRGKILVNHVCHDIEAFIDQTVNVKVTLDLT